MLYVIDDSVCSTLVQSLVAKGPRQLLPPEPAPPCNEFCPSFLETLYVVPSILNEPFAIRFAHLPTTKPSFAICLPFQVILSIEAPLFLNLTTNPFSVDN